MSEDWVDDLPHEAPGLAAMAAARSRSVSSESAPALLLATRDTLAHALLDHAWQAALAGCLSPCGWEVDYDSDIDEHVQHAAHVADALVRSRVVRDPATLADDAALVEAVATKVWKPMVTVAGVAVTPAALGSTAVTLRALAAALTEDPS